MEKQARFYSCFVYLVSFLTGNIFGFIYGCLVRSRSLGTLKDWIDTFSCTRLMYIFNMLYYIGGLITCASFNISTIVNPDSRVHITWFPAIYILCISSLFIFYSTQSAYSKLYPESACLVKECVPNNYSPSPYPVQANYHVHQFIPPPAPHPGYSPPIVNQPPEVKYPLIQ